MVSLFWKIAFHIIIIVHTRLRKMKVPQKCRQRKANSHIISLNIQLLRWNTSRRYFEFAGA